MSKYKKTSNLTFVNKTKINNKSINLVFDLFGYTKENWIKIKLEKEWGII